MKNYAKVELNHEDMVQLLNQIHHSIADQAVFAYVTLGSLLQSTCLFITQEKISVPTGLLEGLLPADEIESSECFRRIAQEPMLPSEMGEFLNTMGDALENIFCEDEPSTIADLAINAISFLANNPECVSEPLAELAEKLERIQSELMLISDETRGIIKEIREVKIQLKEIEIKRIKLERRHPRSSRVELLPREVSDWMDEYEALNLNEQARNNVLDLLMHKLRAQVDKDTDLK